MKDKKISSNEQTYEALKGTIGFFLYFVLSYGTTIPLILLGVDYTNMSMTAKQIYLILYSLLTVFIFFLLYRKDLIKEAKDFKNNFKTYFQKYFKYWLFALAIMYVSNLVIAFIKYKTTGSISVAGNEENIRETLIKAPFYTFIAASFTAPFIEEMTFRKSLRKVFNNDWVFIIISSFIFGGLHVFTTNVTPIDLLYLIPYCAPGVAFAYILVKSKNTFNTISLHLLHNTLLMILQVVLLTRGML